MRMLLDLPLEAFRAIEQSSYERTSTSRKLLSTLSRAMVQFNNTFVTPSNIDTFQPPLASKQHSGIKVGNTKSILASMTQVMGLMVNVKDFVIEWRGLPLTSSAQSLISSTSEAFRSSLCKLTLSGHLTRLATIVSLIGNITLEELDLQFDFNSREADEKTRNEAAFVEAIVPFINQSRTTLHSLKIVSHAFCDHSNFFMMLQTFPSLHRFTLHVPFDSEQLSDSAGILTFLQTHCYSLHHLELLPHKPNDHEEASALSNWSQFCQKFAAFDAWDPNLLSFCIASWNWIDTLALVRRLPSSLTGLRITHQYLRVHQIAELSSILEIQVFSLKSLALDVHIADRELLELLATTFPGLYELTLVVEIGRRIVSSPL
jgi:hypothetical protein